MVSNFVTWNLGTLVGVMSLSSAGDLIERWGLDATIPGVFLALLWPRLGDPVARGLAVAGASVALALAPVTPAGVPIIAAAGTVVLARPWAGEATPEPEPSA